MHSRNSESIVTFRRPFAVGTALSNQPAGSYRVTRVEELLEGVSFPAYHLISTTLQIPAIGIPSLTKQFVEVADADLSDALERDELGLDNDQTTRIDGVMSMAERARKFDPLQSARNDNVSRN